MSKRIQLPTFLSQLVEESPYNYIVNEAIRYFTEWYKDSTLPFSPDYTNHGIAHLEDVMTTAEALITPDAKRHFSDADAVALVLAVLLHDSALHLSKDGFWELIKGSFQSNYIQPFDKQGWQQTWDDFFFAARRWDDTKLGNVFGTNQQGVAKAQVRDPFDHWNNLEESDRLLIGEFIRQHHPRIAHEMALYGIPGNKGTAFSLHSDLSTEWRNLVGLIARSHGLALRLCVDYLGKEFGQVAKREYQSVHAVYLMALLRIADYIQIQPSRTSTLVFKYKSVSSRISEIEHKVHQSVRNITNKGDDPESIHIDAYPAEVAVFLRLKEWLAGIQSELDASWAVLGEVYGRYPEDLKDLGMRFRRIRSNLDDVADFAKEVPYVPDRIRFDVARAELLKLLIGPLYGDDPSYGVRELMQNSIDAVREYEQFVQDHPEYADVPRREQEADVVIELSPLDETGHAIMTISDRGIGMKEEVIKDYFLRAGASYRQSSQWKSTFESDETEGVKSKVLRSGRFGVGALAAFLIGSKVEIQTRHITDHQGYKFQATLESEAIELIITKDLAFGTAITIAVSEESYKKLIENKEWKSKPRNWDWYCFDKPTIRRIFTDHKNRRIAPNSNYVINLKVNWRELRTNLPYKVYWTYDNAPKLTCNGIFITNTNSIDIIPSEFYNYKSDKKWMNGRRSKYGIIKYPNVAVIDPDGNFPINLHRNGIQIDYYPFSNSLAKDIILEMITHLFYNGPTRLNDPRIASNSFDSHASTLYSGIVACHLGFGPLISTLLTPFHIQHVILYNNKLIEFDINKSTVVLSNKYRGLHHGLNDILFLKKHSDSPVHTRKIIYHSDFKSIKGDTLNLKLDGKNPTKIKFEDKNSGVLSICSDKYCPESTIQVTTCERDDLDLLDEQYHSVSSKEFAYERPLIEEVFCPDGCYIKTDPEWLIDKLWIELFGIEWIPFEIEKRISRFPKAAELLYRNYPQVVSVDDKGLIEDLLYKTRV